MSKKKESYTSEEVVEEVIEIEEESVVEDAPEEPVIEEVEEEPVIEEVAEIEEEPVVEVEPVVEEPVAKVAKSSNSADYTYDAWWNEVGKRLTNSGYSLQGIVKRAIKAFGSEFDQERFETYAKENKCGHNKIKRVKAVWDSQK